jgi:hypothetical protein
VLIAAIVVGTSRTGGGGDATCVNRTVPRDVRAQLSTANGTTAPAVQGTVYYGTCGAQGWALATFPDGTDGVFKQSGFHWTKLDSIAAAKCASVPADLLDEWHQGDDC